MTHSFALVACLAAAGLLALSSCSTAPDTAENALSMAETKRTVQLVRNALASQIDTDLIENLSTVRDSSVSCDDSPDGLNRRWRSTVLSTLAAAHAPEVLSIVQEIVGSYVADGWESSSENPTRSTLRVTLAKNESLAKVAITAEEDVDGDGYGATIFMDVTGPCVPTDGPGSDELELLGG